MKDKIYWILVKNSNIKDCIIGIEEPRIEMRQFLDVTDEIYKITKGEAAS